MHVVANTYEPDPLPVPPRKPDGSLYRFEMIFADGRHRVYADEARELLSLLIDGYPDDDDELLTRQGHAQGVVLCRQPLITFEEPEALAQLTADEWAVLSRRLDEPLRIERWDAPVTLLLIDTDFAPFTEHPPPVDGRADGRQRIVWLRTADEEMYLRSLAECGWIGLAALTWPGALACPHPGLEATAASTFASHSCW